MPSARGLPFPVADDLLARLPPIQFDHINFFGRYAFTRTPVPGTHPLGDPHTTEGDVEEE
ncbi:hypothetical protein AADR41_12995 [Streptomyces sp. CLV115]|uniref:hypothetical protein n=1 Tax=Streptomyces sp. CLV115 TaxID=3138502 RepID=UPI00313DFCB4